MKKILFLLLIPIFLFAQGYVWKYYPDATTFNENFSNGAATFTVTGDDSVFSAPINLSGQSGDWSTDIKFSTVSGTPNFKVVVQLQLADNSWYDVSDLTFYKIDGTGAVTSFTSTEEGTFYFFSTVYSSDFWTNLIYYQIRLKIVFTGAQSVKIWQRINYH